MNDKLMMQFMLSLMLMLVSRETLLEGMRSTNFVGLSGQVRFRRDGSLMEGKSSSAFPIINVVVKIYREMGIWLKGRGFYRDEREMGQGAPTSAVNENLIGTIYCTGGAVEKIPVGWRKLRVGVPASMMFNKFVEYDSERKVKGCDRVLYSGLHEGEGAADL